MIHAVVAKLIFEFTHTNSFILNIFVQKQILRLHADVLKFIFYLLTYYFFLNTYLTK